MNEQSVENDKAGGSKGIVGDAQHPFEAEALLDTDGAARLLGISPRTVQGWVRQKRIPYVKFGEGRGSLTRFRPAALRAWIEGQEVRPLDIPAGESQ